MESKQALQVRKYLADSNRNPIPCQGFGGIRAEGEECA
jgi:hypothetical protein